MATSFVPIDSAEDPRLADFRSLRDRDLRAAGLFIAEGEVVLPQLMNSQFRTRAVLVSETQARRLKDRLPAQVEIYVAPQAVLEEVVGFAFHRGVLAVGERGAARPLREVLSDAPTPSLVLGLCGITNHDNVGGIFRNAAAFGVDGVLFDEATCDPLYRKAVRVSIGATLQVPFAQVKDERAVIDELVESGYQVLALSPRGDLVIGSQQWPTSNRLALLLGAEGPGLSALTLARCATASIPMHGTWDSLNVSVTSGIALAWLRAPR
jgi:tRNA G18 (ribose-2'-O)-methylase SpoU